MSEQRDDYDRMVEELCLRIEDGRELINRRHTTYEEAYILAEKQVARIRDLQRRVGQLEESNKR
jgi:hypothetical protein